LLIDAFAPRAAHDARHGGSSATDGCWCLVATRVSVPAGRNASRETRFRAQFRGDAQGEFGTIQLFRDDRRRFRHRPRRPSAPAESRWRGCRGRAGSSENGENGEDGESTMNTTSPDRYALVGHPVHHSRSPVIHALFAEQTGQDLTYELIDAEPA